jgi:lycopene cyclase domain-containing protein
VPVYPATSLAAAVAVIVLELAVLRTGIFCQPAYWVALLVSYVFMVAVDGWLTKLSAPIVLYRDGDTSGLRPVWDILAEEFLYAFALLTLVIALWDWAGRREAGPPSAP